MFGGGQSTQLINAHKDTGSVACNRASVSFIFIAEQPFDTFKDVKRHDSFAIIGLVLAELETIASSSLCDGLLYPSKSAFGDSEHIP
ncbi:hypothetical protein Tco_0962179 [Tanacetum coccineum]